jgi:hypothetical protein
MSQPKTLAEVRARLAELAEARQQRHEDPEIALAKATQDLADAEAIDTAEREIGRVGDQIATYGTPRGVVIVKRPNHLLFRRFADAPQLTVAVCEELVLTCLVHPSRDVFEQLAEDFPGILAPLASKVSELAGVRAKDTSGKS